MANIQNGQKTMTMSEYNAANPDNPWKEGVKAVIQTPNGKTYTLDQKQYDWVTSRYKGDWAGTYGYDDADQRVKAAGQMSSMVASSYRDNGIDYQLRDVGLPSINNLEKYLAQYDRWHTGGIKQVFGGVSNDEWSAIGNLYKQDYQYENTPEDQRRKAYGLMPSSYLSKYTDTEIDDELKAKGLPAYSELSKYASRYNNYLGIDTFYKEVAGKWTNLRLAGVKNDGNTYEFVDDAGNLVKGKGSDLYEDAFYNTLLKDATDGSKVYGKIFDLFLNNHKTGTESYIDPEKNRNVELGSQIKAAGKDTDAEDEYRKYNAFSYDDFAGKYDDYYSQLYADYKLPDGQLVKDAIAVQDRDNSTNQFYNITERNGSGETSVDSFIKRYMRDYPNASYEQMFADMRDNGVDEKYIRTAYRHLRHNGASFGIKTNDQWKAVKEGYGNYLKSKITNTLPSEIDDYITSLKGGYTADNVMAALDHFSTGDSAAAEGALKNAKETLLVNYLNDGGDDAEVIKVLQDNKVHEKEDKVAANKVREGELTSFIDAAIKEDSDEDTVNQTVDAIKAGIASILDNDAGTAPPEVVLHVIEQVGKLSWTNPHAVNLALKDLGFSGWDFSGFADSLSYGWTDRQKREFLNNIGEARYDAEELKTLDEFQRNMLKGQLIDQGVYDPTSDAPEISEAELWASQHNTGRLDYENYLYALEWAQEQIAAGADEFETFNTLAGIGLQDEMEAYMPDEWHRIVYDHKASMLSEQYVGEGVPSWDSLTDEQKAAEFGDSSWWKFDPEINRTNKQSWEQQFGAIIPSIAADLVSGGVQAADMVYSIISGKPELWDVTKEHTAAQSKIASYGSTALNTGSQRAASVVSDAVAELGKMYLLGSIGSEIGAGTKLGQILSTTAGTAKSKTVRWMTGFAFDVLKASPFVVSATAHNYAEAKELGATNGEATAYGVVTGMLEGVLEGMNFDKLWGRVVGQDKFAKMLVKGGDTFKNAPVVLKARLASMLISGLSEFTEESASYVAETFWKTHSDWFGGTGWGLDEAWSAEDWIRVGGMGFITGLLGAGLSSGSINEDTIMIEHYKNSKLNQANRIDMNTATRVVELASEAQRERWKNGTLHVMSMDEYAQTMREMDVLNRNEDINAAQNDCKKAVDQANKKYDAVKSVENSARAEMAALDPSDPEYASKMGKLTARITELSKASSDAAIVREDEIQKAQTAMDNRIDEAHKAREAMNAKIQEHFAGLYYSNQALMEKQEYSKVTANVAKAMQDGAETSPEIRAQEAEAKAEATSKLAEAEAAATVEEAAQTAQTPGEAETRARELAYNRVYKDQESGKAYANERGTTGSKMTPVQFAENERQNFQAKTTAKLRRVTLELAGLEAKEGMSAKEIFEEAKKAMTPEAVQKLEVYQKLSKALGLNMVVRDVVAGTSGYVHDGKLYVTLNGKQSMLRVAAHELTHYMKGYAGAQYDTLRNHLIEEVGGQEEFDKKVAEKAKEYGLDISNEQGRIEADDELCAELCEKMLESKDALERFVSKDMDAAKTLKTRLAKTLVAIKSAIRSIGTSDAESKADLIKEQDTIESWYKGLSDAIDAANAKAKAKPVSQTETEAVTTEAQPQAPPTAEANPDLYMDEESARREQLRSDLLKLAEKGTRVKGLTYQEVNDVLDRVIFGDKSNYNKADYAQVRGMLAQLIPEVTAVVNEDANVDLVALNERVSAALDYMLSRYQEASDGTYNLAEAFPNKIALTELAYKDLRAREITLREASNRLRNALGGKFVSFVYKRSPEYKTATKIDQLWEEIAQYDPNYDADTYGNVGEDALALIEYAERKSGDKFSFDDLYGSQRSDVVASQVGEFLDAVQSMVEGRNAEQGNVRHMIDDESGLPIRFDNDTINKARELASNGASDNVVYDETGIFLMPNGDLLDPNTGKVLWRANDNGNTQRPNDVLNAVGEEAGTRAIQEYDLGRNEVESELDSERRPARRTWEALSEKQKTIVADTITDHVANNRNADTDVLFRGWPAEEYARFVYDAYKDGDAVMEWKCGFIPEIDTLIEKLNAALSNTDSKALYVLDDDYMPIAERYDAGIATEEEVAEMQRDVDEAAEAAGFPAMQYDPVIYDANGDVVPLSERFSQDFAGNRYTVDDDLDELVKKYGAIEQGRNPRARDVQVPKQADEKRYVSKTARTLAESNKTTDETAKAIIEEAASGSPDWTYIRKSNDEQMKWARGYIARRQPTAAQQEFHDRVTQGKLGAQTKALGLQLIADAAERGDQEAVKAISVDLRIANTDEGQSIQLNNVLKDLKGVGSAWYVEALVDKLNTMYDEDIQSGKMEKVVVSDETMDKLRAAKTAAEVEAAEDAAAEEIAAFIPLKFTDKMSSWRYLSMLGNPVTHVRNFGGNVLMGGMNTAKDSVAALLERALNVDESERSHATLTGADKDYWEDFAQQSYDDNRRNLMGGGKIGFESFLKQHMRSFDNKYLEAIANGSKNGKNVLTKNGVMGMLEVADEWFLKPAYKKALMQRMKAQGYTLNSEGKVGKVDSDGKFTEIGKGEMVAAEEWAADQAWKATFRSPNQLATEINRISKMNTASKLFIEGIMPFKKTPINIARTGAMYSPLGVAIGAYQYATKVKQGKMSAAQAIDNMASGLTGSALMALGVLLAKAGLIRSGGEKDKKLETFLQDTGDQTYALKFGDASINMSAIAPATIPLFMGVALNEMIDRSGGDIDLSTVTDVLAGTLNPFMEMSFMSSINSALKNYNSDGIGGALGNTIMTAAENYGSQFLPTFGAKVAQFADPTQRTTKSDITSPVGSNLDYYGRSLAKKVPGLEATLQPDVDIWGRTNTKDTFGEWALDFANKFILPTNVKITNRDDVDNELIRVVESTGVTDFLPSDGSKYFTVNKQRYEMNARQYTEYSKDRGQAAYAALKDVMASSAYSAATDEEKANMLKKAKEAAYKQVNNLWKEKLGAYDKK